MKHFIRIFFSSGIFHGHVVLFPPSAPSQGVRAVEWEALVRWDAGEREDHPNCRPLLL